MIFSQPGIFAAVRIYRKIMVEPTLATGEIRYQWLERYRDYDDFWEFFFWALHTKILLSSHRKSGRKSSSAWSQVDAIKSISENHVVAMQ